MTIEWSLGFPFKTADIIFLLVEIFSGKPPRNGFIGVNE